MVWPLASCSAIRLLQYSRFRSVIPPRCRTSAPRRKGGSSDAYRQQQETALISYDIVVESILLMTRVRTVRLCAWWCEQNTCVGDTFRDVLGLTAFSKCG